MGIRLFLAGAIVLIVFAIIATASNTGTLTLFGVTWFTWLCASLLSFFTDLLLDGPAFDGQGFHRGKRGERTS